MTTREIIEDIGKRGGVYDKLRAAYLRDPRRHTNRLRFSGFVADWLMEEYECSIRVAERAAKIITSNV